MKEEISNVELDELKGESGKGNAIESDYSLIADVEVTLSAYLGDAKLPIGELFSLTNGAVVPLETKLSEPVCLYLKDKLVAKGNIVAVDDSYGIEISEIV